MKPRHTLALFLLGSTTLLHAASGLPAKDDREGWSRLTDQFAECSAVYNLTATLKEMPEKVNTPYRELANNALVAALFSAQRLGLGDSYLESIYSTKFSLWQTTVNDSSQAGTLLAKAEQCLAELVALQNELLGTLRENTANP